ncbi:serine/threonine-protein kinase [Streptomyces sp. NBC_00335]|uniref:serine/threonine-protein kinase n=1 Tax=unclassified Streptomyces TaxID=2593676 RepID=UPI00224FE233|nr:MULTISPECIES: serine/threonine-protein kinase [unclassified Streptomyces]MCX5403595.1 serine/threonine-protein kinase [Streptomyces sp. NBC_00086]
MEELTGQDPRVLGGYRLLSRLGQGGMGRVYLASDGGDGLLAVKVIHPEYAGNEEFRRRFQREVRAAARVKAVGVARVIAADPHAELPWLATEYIPGLSLAEAIDAHGALPAGSCHHLAAQLAQALSAVHTEGLVHRDLKPSNVILGASGAHLIDFGIARAADDSVITHTGQTPGTPGFIAPEVLRGKDSDARADVFALGAVLAFAAQGRHPYGTGAPIVVMARPLAMDPDLSGVSDPVLADLLPRCLATDPAARPDLGTIIRAVTDGYTPTRFWVPATVLDAIGQRSLTARHLTAPPFPRRPSGPPGHLGPPGGTAQPAGASPPLHHAETVTHAGDPSARTQPAPDAARARATSPDPASPLSTIRPSRRTLVRGTLAAAVIAAGAAGGISLIDSYTKDREKDRKADQRAKDTDAKNKDKAKEAQRAHEAEVRAAAVPLQERTIWSRPLDGWVRATPCLSGSTLYVTDNGDTLRSVSLKDGSVRWTHGVDGFGTGDSPVAVGGVVAALHTSGLDVLDAGSGKRLWTADGPMGQLSQHRGRLVFDDGYFISCFTTSGSRVWNRRYNTVQKKSGPLVTADDTLTIVSGDGKLVAINLADGRTLWEHQVDTGGEAVTAVSDGSVVVFGSAGVSSFELRTGTEQWNVKVPGLGGGVELVIHTDTVYVGAGSHGLFAYELSSGKERWHASDGPHSGLRPASDMIYGYGTTIVAVNKADGSTVWSTVVDNDPDPDLVLGAEGIYIHGDGDKTLCCLDHRTGRFRWTIPGIQLTDGSPVPTPDKLLVGIDGTLHALKV